MINAQMPITQIFACFCPVHMWQISQLRFNVSRAEFQYLSEKARLCRFCEAHRQSAVLMPPPASRNPWYSNGCMGIFLEHVVDAGEKDASEIYPKNAERFS